MIPREIFTSFAEFQRIVSVNDFRLLLGFQEFLQTPLCFLRNICFARICLDPLSGWVLHHDCISVIVSRFTIVTEDLVICCNQITKIFCTKYCSAIASSARSSCNFSPLTDLAIPVFREVSFNTVFAPNLHFSQTLKMIHEKNLCVSLCVQELCHPQDSTWILAAIPVYRNTTGLSVLSSPHVHLTQILYGNLPTQIFPFSSLTVAWHNYGWWCRRARRRCKMINLLPWRCHGCWRGKTGRRTRWQTKNHERNEVLPCCTAPEYRFLMRCGFWPLIHPWEYPCSSQSFPSDKTAGVSSKSFIV